MRNKKVVIGLIVIVAFIGLILITKATMPKISGKKAIATAAMKKEMAKAPAKKVFPKGRGGLTVNMLNSKNIEVPIKYRAFKVVDGKSSVYAASSVGSRMQEMASGTYDIEIDTVPQKILKDIKVPEGKEAVESLGCVTGSLVVKAVTGKHTPANYPIRIINPKTGDMITAYMTNKTIEIIPGLYDIETGITPRLYKKDVKVEAGKEAALDLGCVTGSLLVKTVDEDQKPARVSVRITNSSNGEIVSSGASNRPMELGQGTYNIELLTTPKQVKKDVKLSTGEEVTADFVVKAPPVKAKPVPVKAKQ